MTGLLDSSRPSGCSGGNYHIVGWYDFAFYGVSNIGEVSTERTLILKLILSIDIKKRYFVHEIFQS